MAKDTFTLDELNSFKIGGEPIPAIKGADAAKKPAAAAKAATDPAPAETGDGEGGEASAGGGEGTGDGELETATGEGEGEMEVEAATGEGDGDATATGEGEGEGGDEDPAAGAPAHMVPKGRFNQVIEERNALRKQNEYLMDLAAKQAQGPAEKGTTDASAATTTAAPAEDAIPTLESVGFDTVKYEAAMKAWSDKRIAAATDTGKKVGAEEAGVAALKATFEKRMNDYAKANPKVVIALGNPNLPQLAKAAATIVMESELGPQILAQIAINPAEAVRIARLTPEKQAAAVGRIEGEIRARKAAAGERRTTKAPNPPTDTKGAATMGVDGKTLSTKKPGDKATTAEWIAHDRKQEEIRRAQRRPGQPH